MKFKLDNYHRNITIEELIEDIIKVSKQLNKNSVTMLEYENYGEYCPGTLIRRFGSWFKVLDAAKLSHNRSQFNIPEEDLFGNLENVWIKLGRQPRREELKNPFSKYSGSTYARRFGTWRKALEKFVLYINSDSENDKIEENFQFDDDKTSQSSKETVKHKTKRAISDRLRFRVLMRDGFTCKSCGRSPINEIGVELHVDHILPWSKGGETVPENLETKCKKCNLGKGNAFNC